MAASGFLLGRGDQGACDAVGTPEGPHREAAEIEPSGRLDPCAAMRREMGGDARDRFAQRARRRVGRHGLGGESGVNHRHGFGGVGDRETPRRAPGQVHRLSVGP
jgi:hypothetical protein